MASMGTMDQSSRPEILLVSLSFSPWHYEMFSNLINKISDRAQIKRAQDRDAALRALTNTRPQAIIATDEGIADRRNRVVLDRVVEYARSGGTVLLGFVFSSMTNGPDMDATFSRFGLPWRRGGYDRSTFSLHQGAIRDLDGRNLPRAYSQKATRVALIDRQNALYIATEHQDEAANAWTKVGDGHLGYIGDVNAEEESDFVVLAMCGL